MTVPLCGQNKEMIPEKRQVARVVRLIARTLASGSIISIKWPEWVPLIPQNRRYADEVSSTLTTPWNAQMAVSARWRLDPAGRRNFCRNFFLLINLNFNLLAQVNGVGSARPADGAPCGWTDGSIRSGRQISWALATFLLLQIPCHIVPPLQPRPAGHFRPDALCSSSPLCSTPCSSQVSLICIFHFFEILKFK